MSQQKFEIQNVDVCEVALVICHQAADIPESRRPHVLQDIWRRIFISGDSEIWRLEDFTDEEIRERLMNSWMCRAYAVIYKAEGQKDEWVLRPEDARCTMPAAMFKERFMSIGLLEGDYQKSQNKGISSQSNVDKNCEAMIRDYERENEELEIQIQDGQLVEKWALIKEIVKEELARAAGEIPSLGSQDMVMEDVEMEEDFA